MSAGWQSRSITISIVRDQRPAKDPHLSPNIRKIRFFRRHIPRFDCIPGCHNCCGPVTASSEEMIELPTVNSAKRAHSLESLSCPQLHDNGCMVYEDRPLVCRLFGTTTRLPCPHGRRPERMIDSRVDLRIARFHLETRQVLV